MLNIYLVRHAQTEANKQHIIQGQTDTAITDNGYIHTKKTADFFKDKDISAIYSSPLGRTAQTSEMICDAIGMGKDKIIFLDELMEIDLKPWVNKPISEISADESVYGYYVYRNNPMAFQASEGENFNDVQSRAVKAYNHIINSNKNANIIIVSHSVTIRTLLLYLDNKGFDQVWSYSVNPASVSKITSSNGNSKIEFIGFCPYEI